jgi:nucleotide-binding universal stress UspA family protein
MISVAVAIQNDNSCKQAIIKAIDLVRNLSSYKLYFVYAVAQSSPSTLPYLDHLDQAHNAELHAEAIKDIKQLMAFIDSLTADVQFEFVKLEEQKDVGEIILNFCESVQIDLFYVGTHKQSGLKKFVLGSTSQFCVDRLPCPVVVVQPDN